MLNNTISEIVFFNTRSSSHEGRTHRSIACTINGRETISVVSSVTFCNIVNDITAFWSTFANKRCISITQSKCNNTVSCHFIA